MLRSASAVYEWGKKLGQVRNSRVHAKLRRLCSCEARLEALLEFPDLTSRSVIRAQNTSGFVCARFSYGCFTDLFRFFSPRRQHSKRVARRIPPSREKRVDLCAPARHAA